MSDLTAEQAAALDQLVAITAPATDADRARDVRVLHETGFNVQAAVEVIFSSPPVASSSISSSSRPPTASSRPDRSASYTSMDIDDSDQALPLVNGGSSPSSSQTPPSATLRRTAGLRLPRGVRGITRVGLGLGFTLYSIVLWPLGVLWGIVVAGWSWLVPYLPSVIRAALPYSMLSSSRPTRRSGTRASGSATLRFVHSLETLTGARSPSTLGSRAEEEAVTTATSSLSHGKRDNDQVEQEHEESGKELPEFFVGSYANALELAKREGRVVLVGLFSEAHQGDAEWKKNVLTDPELVATIKQHNIIFYAGDVQDREPYQVSRLLPPTTYPSLSFISLLAPSSSTTSAPPKLTVLSRLESPGTTASQLVQTLTQSVLPRVKPTLDRLARERRLREEERTLRAQQDAAFERAAREDYGRIMKAREARELEERREREKEARVRAKERRRRFLRWARKHALGEEPPATGGGDVMVVTVRVPPGREVHRRRFEAGMPLDRVFVWAETLCVSDADENEDEEEGDIPTEAETTSLGFRLATSYPRRVLEREGTVGGCEALRAGGGVLVLERTDGAADDDAEGAEEADEDEDDDEDDE